MLLRMLLIVMTLLVRPFPALRAEEKVKTVNVDCARGQSINQALQDKAAELIIEVRGICREAVVLRRDRVTLRGSDPASDGIESPSDGLLDVALQVEQVAQARSVVIERLTLRGGRSGAAVADSRPFVTFSNCRIEGNSGFGLILSDAELIINDCLISGNGSGGAAILRNSNLTCNDCVIEQNPLPNQGTALLTSGSSRVFYNRGRLSGQTAASVAEGSEVNLTDTEVESLGFGFRVQRHSRGRLVRTSVEGSFLITDKSQLSVFGVEQTALGTSGGVPRPNLVTNDSLLVADCADCSSGLPVSSSLLATDLVAFSQAHLGALGTAEELACSTGSDAICQGTLPLSSSCGSCPVP